ncbi:MAG: DNRLRE domain-containing protein [Gammaproteobacteria bacterium]
MKILKRSIYGSIPEKNQQGFILVTVLLMISLIASVAYLANTSSIFNSSQTVSKIDSQKARYAAEAGLIYAADELSKDLDCTGYAITSTGTFEGYPYTASLSATSGSPVTVNVVMDSGSGSSHSVSRDVVMTKNGETEADLKEDSYSNASDANKNYEKEKELHVKAGLERRTFLKFDMGKINIDPAVITGADLRLFQKGSAESKTLNISLYRVTEKWKEKEVTHNNREKKKKWKKDFGVIQEFAQPAVDSITVDELYVDWKIWDVTSLVTGWLDGTFTDYGLALSSSDSSFFGSGNNVEFYSQESSDSTKHPKLVITHLCECGTSGC